METQFLKSVKSLGISQSKGYPQDLTIFALEQTPSVEHHQDYSLVGDILFSNYILKKNRIRPLISQANHLNFIGNIQFF